MMVQMIQIPLEHETFNIYGQGLLWI